MPDDGPARQTATALLVLESVMLGLSLPVQLFLLLSLGWEGGDEHLKQRLLEAMPLLMLGALLAAVLAAFTAYAVHRDAAESMPLTIVTAGLALALGAGWLVGLRGAVVDPMWGTVWGLMTTPPCLALLVLRVHHRVRRGSSPPRSPGSGGAGAR
jgi:hypothetical protein